MTLKEWQRLSKKIRKNIGNSAGVCNAIYKACSDLAGFYENYHTRETINKLKSSLEYNFKDKSNPRRKNAYFLGELDKNNKFRRDCWDLLSAKIEASGRYKGLRLK